MHILISDVCLVVGIGPVSVHELDGLIHSERVECVIVSKHKLLNLVFHEDPIDFKTWTQRFVLIYKGEAG